MIERRQPIESNIWHTYYTFTSDDIERLGYDPDLLDGLGVIKAGIQDLQNINGVTSVADWQSEYALRHPTISDDPGTPIGYDHSRMCVPIWEANKKIGRQSIMIVERNQYGISGAVDFREYMYGGTGERAAFIHWIGVQYEARKMEVASRLYGVVFERAKADGIGLVLAGVNPLNKPSVGLHEKLGFVCEEYSPDASTAGPKVAYATQRGVYNPSYSFTDIDSKGRPIEGVTKIYSKRI